MLVSILLAVCILSPFFPGPSNAVVIGLSLFGQYIGFAGWLLVPVGLTWLAGRMLNERRNGSLQFNKYLKVLSWIVVAGLVIFFLVFTFAIILQNGWIAGLTMLLSAAMLLITGIRQSVKQQRDFPWRYYHLD